MYISKHTIKNKNIDDNVYFLCLIRYNEKLYQEQYVFVFPFIKLYALLLCVVFDLHLDVKITHKNPQLITKYKQTTTI